MEPEEEAFIRYIRRAIVVLFCGCILGVATLLGMFILDHWRSVIGLTMAVVGGVVFGKAVVQLLGTMLR